MVLQSNTHPVDVLEALANTRLLWTWHLGAAAPVMSIEGAIDPRIASIARSHAGQLAPILSALADLTLELPR